MSNVPFFSAREIAPRSWQIQYSFTDQEHVYCYLTEGRDCALAIDTMVGHGNLRAFLSTLTDKPVKLVNTHFHFDHCGGNYSFDACYIHPKDLPYIYAAQPKTATQMLESARAVAFPEFAGEMEESDFFPEKPIRVYPVWHGDCFDLGERQIEAVCVGGHTPGSIVLIDRAHRIAYSGDACNGNTLLYFEESLSVEAYLRNLLRLKRYQGDFDIMYGGHEVLTPEVIDEAIELCARVLAGSDDREPAIGLFGQPVVYAAKRADGGFARADGKRFNIAYDPKKRFSTDKKGQIL